MYTATNTLIVVPEFDYQQPETLADVFALLAEHGDQARLIAGGTDLLVQMKMERVSSTCVISLAGVGELNGITSGDGLAVGAMTSVRTISLSEPVRKRYAALVEACDAFSTVPIMIMGTIGGNLCNASPAADLAPALLAFDASVTLVSRAGTRVLSLKKFFTGPGSSALGKGEVLHSVQLPEPTVGTGSAFLKVSRVVADIAQACAAVKLVRDGENITDCRIALGAVAPTPVRVPRAEESLTGRKFDPEAVEAAARIVEEDISPITDVRATAAYRRRVSRVIVRDALVSAWHRAREGSGK
jgi:carbon-monoxide dehydrogenase medium subunit